MSRAGDSEGFGGQENVDATFAAIVADLRAEGLFRLDEPEPEPDQRQEEKGRGERHLAEQSGDQEPRTEPGPSGWRTADRDWESAMLEPDAVPGNRGGTGAEDDEHFVPPEPPPLPRPRKGAFLVLLLFVTGLLLLITPRLIGLSNALGTPLGILALATALALLLLRVKQGPPDGADPENGAQV